MALIQIVAGGEKARERLAGIFKNLGIETAPASTLNDAVSLAEKLRPRAVFAADEADGAPAEVMVRELLRVAPLVPVVVCMNTRDSSRAVELMKAGAFDCVAPPWTEEALRPVLRKALRMSGTAMDLSGGGPSFSKTAPLVFLMLAVAVSAFLVGRFYLGPGKPKSVSSWELPYSHPSGIAFDGGKLWISDWYSQSLYLHEPEKMSVTKVVSLPASVPVTLCAGGGNLWVGTSAGIEKRMPDSKLTVLARYKFPGREISGICHDGLYVWTADAGEGKIRRHITDNELTADREYQVPPKELSAMFCGPRFIWTVDGSSYEILSRSVSDPQTILSKKPLPEYREGWKISGLTGDGGRFWAVAEGKSGGRVFLYDSRGR